MNPDSAPPPATGRCHPVGASNVARRLSAFVESFVAPLLSGGALSVGAPVRPAEVMAFVGEAHTLRHGPLPGLRHTRAQRWLAEPSLPDPDAEELALWVGLYNLLALDHPERDRVWARASTWGRVEQATRYWLQLSHVSVGSAGDMEAALARHVSVDALLGLLRRDEVLVGPEGEQRFIGQEVPRRRLRWAVPGALQVREEEVHWWSTSHSQETDRLLADVLWASPVTCLLRPTLAPPGWNPLTAASFLLQRGFVRSVCHAWAGHRQWIAIGGAVLGALLFTLTGRPTSEPTKAATGNRSASTTTKPVAALPATPVDAGPAEVAALIGALIHVHFLRVLEFGARLGVAPSSRDRPVQMFLALPLLLPALEPVLGAPVPSEPHGFDAQVKRRWDEYIEHLGELMPKSVVENLLATLVPRIVKATSA